MEVIIWGFTAVSMKIAVLQNELRKIVFTFYKQTNKMHFFMYLFYNFCTLYMFRTTISIIIRRPQITVSAALYKPCNLA